jgi:hypothetical protein
MPAPAAEPDAAKVLSTPNSVWIRTFRRGSNIVAKGPPGVDQILCIVSGKPLSLAAESVAGDDFPHLNLSRMATEPEAAASSRCASGAIDCEAAFGATLLEISEIEH